MTNETKPVQISCPIQALAAIHLYDEKGKICYTMTPREIRDAILFGWIEREDGIIPPKDWRLKLLETWEDEEIIGFVPESEKDSLVIGYPIPKQIL